MRLAATGRPPDSGEKPLMASASLYLSLKALHVIFMVTWFAGLFYLPRLFIYHAEASDEISIDRFQTMERRLFIIMTIGAALTAVFGLTLLWLNPTLLHQGWFQVKLVLIALLGLFHWRCWSWIKQLVAGVRPDNTRGLRWFNEVPTVFLIAIVLLAFLKPAIG